MKSKLLQILLKEEEDEYYTICKEKDDVKWACPLCQLEAQKAFVPC